MICRFITYRCSGHTILAFIQALSRFKIHTFLLYHAMWHFALVAWLFRIPVRVSRPKLSLPLLAFDNARRLVSGIGMATHLAPPHSHHEKHATDDFWTFLHALDIPVSELDVSFSPAYGSAEVFQAWKEHYQLDLTEQPIAIFHGRSKTVYKQVPWELYGPALQALHQAGYQIIATGDAADRHGIDALQQHYTIPVMNVAGQTSFEQLLALHRQAALVFTIDSSPVHIAAAVSCPRIVVLHVVEYYMNYWQAYRYNGCLQQCLYRQGQTPVSTVQEDLVDAVNHVLVPPEEVTSAHHPVKTG